MQRLLGKYELLARLATGGMAEVYLARERGIAGLERHVVIKRMLPQIEQSPEHIDMFLREARFIARLNHPNIVQIYELSEVEGSYFFAMEYVDGISLAELMLLMRNRDERIPLELTVEIIAQACRGAHAAHETRDYNGELIGLVHRDMTPHNLMLTVDGHIKLLDFGIAKASHGQESTDSGSIKGKYTYMSPEQALNEPLDRRSDVFALGVILWELCTGQPLFSRESVLHSLNAIAQGEIQSPSEIQPDLDPAIETVILKALARDRDDRYETADALRQDLLAALPEGMERHPERLAGFLLDVAGASLEDRRNQLRIRRERAATDSTFDLPSIAFNDPTLSEAGFEPTVTSGSIRALERASIIPATGKVEPEDAPRPSSVGDTVPNLIGGAPASSKRRLALLAGVAILAVAIAIYGLSRGEDAPEGDDEVPAVSGPAVVIGWPPLLDPELLLRDVEPLHDYLEGAIGQPIEARVSPDYETLTQWVKHGEVDFAFLPPLLYVQTQLAAPGTQLLALKEFDGAVQSMALLLVKMDSPFHQIADLEGKRFCFTDTSSTSGYLMPMAFLYAQGLDPDTFMGGVQWSGNHFQVLRDLLDGRCEVAATFSSSVLPADRYEIPVGQLRTLVVTGKIPEDSICASASTEAALVEKMRKALFAFDPRAVYGSRSVSETQRITAFVAADDATYEDVRAAMKATQQP